MREGCFEKKKFHQEYDENQSAVQSTIYKLLLLQTRTLT